jgi:hypothetical protein
MQNLTPTAASVQPTFSGEGSPEIREALRTLKASEWRLEAEYFSLDTESRFELAVELRSTLDDLNDEQVDELARVINDLEDIDGADFSTWDARTDASARIRRVVRSLESDRRHARA